MCNPHPHAAFFEAESQYVDQDCLQFLCICPLNVPILTEKFRKRVYYNHSSGSVL